MAKSDRDYFSISVKVIEASDLPHPNISSFACVQVGKHRKFTKTVKHTDKPRFGEFFVFDIYTDFSSLMKTIITLSLYEPKKHRIKKLIGCISLEVSTLWELDGHRLNKWLVINIPSEMHAVPKGFVSTDILLEAAQKYIQVPNIIPVDIPEVLGGSRARYIVRIYHGVGLVADQCKNSKTPPQAFVKASFANKSETTTKRKLGQDQTIWNEQITFIELLPPLFQKITIDLYVDTKKIGTKELQLSNISHISKKGFFPTYGPTHVHLYENEFLYRGSLVISIDTELITLFKFKEKLHGVLRRPIPPNDQQELYKTESFLCFGVVFDAVLKNHPFPQKEACLSLGFGRSPEDTSLNCNPITSKFKIMQENYNTKYLLIKEEKPCVFMRSEWADSRHRLYNSNVISNLIFYLKEREDFAQNLLSRGNTTLAEDILKATVRKFKTGCKKIPAQLTVGVTKYDAERITFITNRLTVLSDMATRGSGAESLIEKLRFVISVLETMCEDVQDSIPYILVFVKEGTNVLGYCKVHPREIIFSKTDIRKGLNSGKVITVRLKKPDQSDAGQISVWLWLGLWDQVPQCLSSLPSGHEDITKVVALPLSLTYLTNERYTAICHIYRGNIDEGEDADGICDPFVSTMLSYKSKQTTKFKGSLAPMWKETLVLNDIQLYPTPSYLERNPPMISVELWNGSCKPIKVLGRALVEPKVRLRPFSKQNEYDLRWIKLDKCQLLSVFEIIQTTKDRKSDETLRLSEIVTEFVDPPTIPYRLEVVFWGIRASDISGLKNFTQPQVIIQCGSAEVKSELAAHANRVFNFKHNLHVLNLELPTTKLYAPPLVLRLISSVKLFGSIMNSNLYQYVYNLPTEKQWKKLTTHRKSVVGRAQTRHSSVKESMPDLIPLIEYDSDRKATLTVGTQNIVVKKCMPFYVAIKLAIGVFNFWVHRLKKAVYIEPEVEEEYEEKEEEEEHDWWYRYTTEKLAKYKSKLEDVKEFQKFNDVLKTFEIKQMNVEQTACVKLMMCLYRWPIVSPVVTTQGQDPELGVIKHIQLSERSKVLVRVYCIKAHNLHPADFNGSADPFIEIATPSKVVSDENNYIPRQLNPVFGKCLEIVAELPVDTILTVRVMDYDRLSANDLIGETVIDLENRLHSKHRATCGLPSLYSTVGNNTWKDVEKPTQILEKLCNTYNLPLPQYYEKSVLAASKEFVIEKKDKDEERTQEKLALQALRHWNEVPIIGIPLVPEHVETRPLFSKRRPGIEQGRLEMWVDIFDLSLGEVPPPIDITPRQPQPYELRVIIWNTAKVALMDDSFFVGKKHTDIFVKSWIWDSKDAQQTDVHYTSLNGKGNFNWRFIFPFKYLKSEQRMVIYKRNAFDIGKTEYKVPVIIFFQIWDHDKLSQNDFIGSMQFELCRMPRGARSVRTCNWKSYQNPRKTVDLFKVKHMKGWWPFIKAKDETKTRCGGFLEAEFQILTEDEAAATPAGRGRSEPSALPIPKRPKVKVKFWLAPIRMILRVACGVHRTKILSFFVIVAVFLFILVAVYSLPIFLIKKVVGA